MSAAPKQCHYFTLWIKRPSFIKMNNVLTADNCKKIRRESATNRSIRLVNEGFRGHSYRKNTMSELKAVLEMTTAYPDTKWKTATPLTHSCSSEGVIQLGPLTRFWFWWCDVWGRRDQWCVFCTPSLAVCAIYCSQLDLNLANLEAT